MFSSPAVSFILIHNVALKPSSLTFAIRFTFVIHDETLRFTTVRQNFASQELLHLGIIKLGAQIKIRPYLTILPLGATDKACLAFDIAEDVIRVIPLLPICLTLFTRAFKTTSNYLVDIDVDNLLVFRIRILMNLERDVCVCEDGTKSPADSLL